VVARVGEGGERKRRKGKGRSPAGLRRRRDQEGSSMKEEGLEVRYSLEEGGGRET
jgi:hypothetical protein